MNFYEWLEEIKIEYKIFSTNQSDLWKKRQDQCEKILNDLFTDEFRSIKHKVSVFISDYPAHYQTAIIIHPFGFKWLACIFLKGDLWDEYPGFNSKDIREILQHELLHLELYKSDEDPEFIEAARERNIDLKFWKD